MCRISSEPSFGHFCYKHYSWGCLLQIQILCYISCLREAYLCIHSAGRTYEADFVSRMLENYVKLTFVSRMLDVYMRVSFVYIVLETYVKLTFVSRILETYVKLTFFQNARCIHESEFCIHNAGNLCEADFCIHSAGNIHKADFCIHNTRNLCDSEFCIHAYIRSAGSILSYDQRFIVVFKSVLCPQNPDCPLCS